ncbi:hypothetical protein GCM10010109_77600 [Actinoplanes campanulatus]|nr:hypothetical protein GCM10010109_77600 [Actinoplanes campanulatus]GID37371.1 hypothetical protein Aca09nite_38770 [Actinoplanes campanulatus]
MSRPASHVSASERSTGPGGGGYDGNGGAVVPGGGYGGKGGAVVRGGGYGGQAVEVVPGGGYGGQAVGVAPGGRWKKARDDGRSTNTTAPPCTAIDVASTSQASAGPDGLCTARPAHHAERRGSAAVAMCAPGKPDQTAIAAAANNGMVTSPPQIHMFPGNPS